MWVPQARNGETVEQSFCRQATEEEKIAVKKSTSLRMFNDVDREMRLDPGRKPSDLD